MKTFNSITFAIFLFLSCNAQQKTMPEIGNKIPDSISLNKGTYIMISSAQLEPSYDIIIKGIKYTICMDKSNISKYIETKDSSFITSDNIKIGMSLKVLSVYQKMSFIWKKDGLLLFL